MARQPTYRNPDGYTVVEDEYGNWRVVGKDGKLGAFAKKPVITTGPAEATELHSSELEVLLKELSKLQPLVEEVSASFRENRTDLNYLIKTNVRLYADVTDLFDKFVKLYNTVEQRNDADQKHLLEQLERTYSVVEKLLKAQETLSREIEERSNAQQEQATRLGESQERIEEAVERLDGKADSQLQHLEKLGTATSEIRDGVNDLKRHPPLQEPEHEPKKETAMLVRKPYWAAAGAAALLVVIGGILLASWPSAPQGTQALTKEDVKSVVDSAFTTFETNISGKVKSLETHITTGLTTLTGRVNTLEQAHASLKKAFEDHEHKPAAQEPSAQPAAPAASAPQAGTHKAPEGETEEAAAPGTPVPPVSEEETIRRVDYVREVCHRNGFHNFRISVAKQLANVKDLSAEDFTKYVKDLCHPGRDDPNPPAMKPKEQMVVRVPRCAEGEFDPQLSICVVRSH